MGCWGEMLPLMAKWSASSLLGTWTWERTLTQCTLCCALSISELRSSQAYKGMQPGLWNLPIPCFPTLCTACAPRIT